MANEFINQVKADASAYLKTQTIVSKLRIVGALSKVLGLFLLLLTIILLAFGVAAFGGVAAVIGLSRYMPMWAAALVMGGIFILVAIIIYAFRKKLFINPFVAILSGVFFAEEGRKAEEERLREEAIND
ncbi:MAG: hypothetical protein IJS82_03565 [Paludibacteraceae bacterium]|nr:hypothetical protein [Paludibacteraceae bacterium]